MTGYEIHLGKTSGPDCARPFARIDGVADGAMSASGRVTGTYIHGCFGADHFRSAFLTSLSATPSNLQFDGLIDETLDALARHLEQHLDLDRLLSLAGPV